MKPIRISRLKYSVLLAAALVFFISAISIQAARANSGKALLDAASKGDATKVKTLLAQGAEVYHKNFIGMTALDLAKTPAIAQLLKAAGAK